MSDKDAPEARLRELGERIEAARHAQKPAPRKRDHLHKGAALAWRMIFELVAGTAIGCAMGWGLDSLLGTLPLFLIIMTLFGMAAGVRLVIQTAQEANRIAMLGDTGGDSP